MALVDGCQLCFPSNYLWYSALFQHLNIKVWFTLFNKQILHMLKQTGDWSKSVFFSEKCLRLWGMPSIQGAYLGFRSRLRVRRHKARLCQFIYRFQRNRSTDVRSCGLLSLVALQVWEDAECKATCCCLQKMTKKLFFSAHCKKSSRNTYIFSLIWVDKLNNLQMGSSI